MDALENLVKINQLKANLLMLTSLQACCEPVIIN